MSVGWSRASRLVRQLTPSGRQLNRCLPAPSSLGRIAVRSLGPVLAAGHGSAGLPGHGRRQERLHRYRDQGSGQAEGNPRRQDPSGTVMVSISRHAFVPMATGGRVRRAPDGGHLPDPRAGQGDMNWPGCKGRVLPIASRIVPPPAGQAQRRVPARQAPRRRVPARAADRAPMVPFVPAASVCAAAPIAFRRDRRVARRSGSGASCAKHTES